MVKYVNAPEGAGDTRFLTDESLINSVVDSVTEWVKDSWWNSLYFGKTF